MFIHLNTWSTVGGADWGGVEDVSLEVCNWR